jgi:hypothetical protein
MKLALSGATCHSKLLEASAFGLDFGGNAYFTRIYYLEARGVRCTHHDICKKTFGYAIIHEVKNQDDARIGSSELHVSFK